MIYRLLFLFWIFLTINVNSFGQFYKQSQADSLSAVLPQQKGKERIYTLLHLADCYYNIQLDTAISYANKAKEESKENDYDWGIYKADYFAAKVQINNIKISEVKKRIEACIDWFKLHSFKEDQLYCELLLNQCLLYTESFKVSKDHADRMLNQAKKLGNTRLIALAYYQVFASLNSQLYITNKLAPLDSAIIYFKQVNDSLQILNCQLYQLRLNRGSRKEIKQFITNASLACIRWRNTKHLIALNIVYFKYEFVKQEDKAHSTESIYSKTLQLAKNYGSELSLSGYYYMAGYVKLKNLHFVKAKNLFEKAKIIHLKLENTLLLTGSAKFLGNTYNKLHNHELAIENFILANRLAKKTNNKYIIYTSEHSLANMYSHTKQYEKAEKTYLENRKFIENNLTEYQQINGFGNSYESLGLLYQKMKQYHQSVLYLDTAIYYASKISFRPDYEIHARTHQITVLLDMNDPNTAQKKYAYLLDQKRFNKTSFPIFFYLQEGRLFFAQKRFNKAIQSFTYFLNNDKSIYNSNDRLLAHQLISNAYLKLGKHKEALEYHTEFKAISDSIQRSNAIENIALIQSRYDLSEKESKIERLEQQKEISDLKLVKQENELSLRKLYITLLFFMLLILGGIGYLRFRRLQFRKEEEKREIKKQLEIENLKSQQKAEVAEVKNKLYANISHEFKTPLTLIRVPLQNFKTNASAEERLVYDSVLKNTDYLLEMIDELLSVSCMDSNKFELHFSNFNLTDFLSRIKLNFEPLFADKNIQFDWAIQLDQNYFYGDESRLNIVINNLLKNAYSNTPKNGWVKCIVQFEEEFKITISNKGKQIDPNDLPHIFERFYRASESSYSGTGIGLSWSKQIIDLHDGTIHVDNSKNGQVTFSVQIPIIDNPEKTVVNLKTNSKVQLIENDHLINAADHHQTYLPHILVVEDNVEMQELLNNVLKSEFRLNFAENGKIGEEMAIQLQPDLILSDLMMPVKDGFELLKLIKENFNSSHIPIILLTARTDSASRIAGLNQDADGYIGKPFDPIELKSKINNLLRQRLNLHKLFSENPLLYRKELKFTPIDADFIDRVRNILNENFSNGDFSTHEFCMELALNRTSVNTKIKALTNQSTAEYIKNFRLEKVAEMLIESNSTITEICTNTGFNNSQVFNKAFKRKFNCTPSMYRSNFHKQ